MRLCEAHITELRAGIAKRGLSSLDSDSDEVCKNHLEEIIAGGAQTIDNFEPTAMANFALISAAMLTGGTLMLHVDAHIDAPDDEEERGGFLCPLCFFDHVHSLYGIECDEFKDWIDHVCDDQLDTWKRLGAAAN